MDEGFDDDIGEWEFVKLPNSMRTTDASYVLRFAIGMVFCHTLDEGITRAKDWQEKRDSIPDLKFLTA